MSDWYVYIIRTRSGTLYTGIATDVERRIVEHSQGGRLGSKYLRSRGPLALAYHVKIGDRSLAARAEWRIKRLTKQKKEEIVSARLKGRALLAFLGLAG